MKEIGFIGFGSMLVNGFLKTRAIQPAEIMISTRTPGKAEGVRHAWPEVKVSRNNRDNQSGPGRNNGT